MDTCPSTYELFDSIRVHLLRQGQKSTLYGTKSYCAYRGDNDMKCAVGFLIKDEHYSPNLEGKTISNTMVRDAVEKSIGRALDSTELMLLRAVQEIHDWRMPSSWEHDLQYLFAINDLEGPTYKPSTYPPRFEIMLAQYLPLVGKDLVAA